METPTDNEVVIMTQGICEKRASRRNDQLEELSAVWHNGGPEHSSCVRDLSLTGAFLESLRPPPEGCLLNLRFKVSDKYANARALVRRSLPGKGMGIEFVAISKEDRTLLALAADSINEPVSTRAGQSAEGISASACNQTGETVAPKNDLKDAGEERRDRCRVKITARVNVTHADSGESFNARLESLSAGGCLLNCSASASLSLGARVIVRIAKGAESFQSEGKVIYVLPSNGIGVMFTGSDAKQQRILGTWIMETSWLAADRRKNQRVFLKIPVMITGQDIFGTAFTENTHTLKINADGCSIALSAFVSKGHTLTVLNTCTWGMTECVVVRIEKTAEAQSEIVTSFLLPNKRFWQVNFPPPGS